jgi:hypothetical protein
VRLRHIFAVLLLLHLLVHPVLHAFPGPEAGEVQAGRSNGEGAAPLRSEEFSCIACRTAGPVPAMAAGSMLPPQDCGEHLPAAVSHSYSGWLGGTSSARAPPAAL